MTAKVSGTTISLTRGDTFRATIDILNPDGSAYVPVNGDSIRFALKKNYKDSDVLIYKDISTADLELTIDPEDTKSLKMPSDYVYDIQLTHANGDIDTFIANAKFHITEEVD